MLYDTRFKVQLNPFTACIGSFGVNCCFPCAREYFGHGCRKKCNCNNTQTCDSKIGCVARNYGIEPCINYNYLWKHCLSISCSFLFAIISQNQIIDV